MLTDQTQRLLSVQTHDSPRWEQSKCSVTSSCFLYLPWELTFPKPHKLASGTAVGQWSIDSTCVSILKPHRSLSDLSL